MKTQVLLGVCLLYLAGRVVFIQGVFDKPA
jgi:hypothetical protein